MKKKMSILGVLVAAVVLTGFSVSQTYAKYTSKVTVAGTATVAKWNIAFKEGETTLTDGAAFKLAMTTNNYVATATAGDPIIIAPGTKGSFALNVVSTETQVAYNYGITFKVTNKPANLKFYGSYDTQSNTYGNPVTYDADTETYTLTNPTYVSAADAPAADVTKTVYWVWDYNTTDGDTADTTDGVAGADMTVNATVTATQANSTPVP